MISAEDAADFDALSKLTVVGYKAAPWAPNDSTS
jgi:hypothetical protein